MPVTTSYVSSEPPSAAEVHPNQATTQPRRLSIPLIILLAVGCALLVIGIFSLTKYYLRPTSRPRPRPSLPVLDDPFADDKEFPLDDSPVFGGKERMSNGIWSWSHYSQPETVVTKPPNVAQPRVPSRENSYQYDSMDHSSRLQGGSTSNSRPCWRTQSTYSGHGYTQSVPTVTSGNSPFQASLQQLQGALSRTATRVSTASTSFYPSSPQPGNVGLAITRSPNTTYTADGSSVLQRSGPKAALDKNRSDMAAEAARGLSSANNRTSEGSHYSGSDVSSPSFLPYTAPPRAAPAKPAGRSRIKSSYYNANSYPRISSNTALASDSNTDASGLEGQASVSKSDARRDRDTRALTQALGLSSPASGFTPPSPQPTLYPDDSLSVVDAKRPRKPQAPIAKKSLSNKDDNRPSLPVISTAMDASAALGSLMLMDYAGQTTRVDDSLNKRMSRTGSSKVSLGGAAAGTTLASAPLKRSPSRSNDKPPSIPLPELLPSLEQMGLEHANPQAYADYRSPTYSIYGMYGDDRKSGAGY
ncbi:hypothetical protein DXG01_017138 [Tephrocybe rancida]|nr:hypothetical protein DXG01_017138 [Tephrocybe rancida]